MKLITFLGTGDYKPATYTHNNKRFETELFSHAVAEWYQPNEVFVLLTPDAKKHDNWKKLKNAFNNSNVDFRGVDIPDGHSEHELWNIFQILSDQLKDNDNVIFDLTHGFRSLPMLAIQAINYLRVAKHIAVQDVLYGAWEARDEANVAPVFSLLPFMQLLDWATATDKFIKLGNANELGDLLNNAHSLAWQSGMPKSELPTQLQGTARVLGDLSSALRLTRPQEIATHSKALATRLEDINEEVQRYAPPFAVLLEQIGDAYLQFSDSSLKTQLELVNWYVQHGQEVQAVTLANEWFISWTCEQLDLDVYKRKTRETVTRAITSVSRKKRDEKYDDLPLVESILTLENSDEKIKIWDKLSALRNDIAHCGMREDKGLTTRLIQSVAAYTKELNDLYDLSQSEGIPS